MKTKVLRQKAQKLRVDIDYPNPCNSCNSRTIFFLFLLRNLRVIASSLISKSLSHPGSHLSIAFDLLSTVYLIPFPSFLNPCNSHNSWTNFSSVFLYNHRAIASSLISKSLSHPGSHLSVAFGLLSTVYLIPFSSSLNPCNSRNSWTNILKRQNRD